jgi:hypothetical protein
VEAGLRAAGAIPGIVGEDGRFYNTNIASDEKIVIK